MRIARTVLPLGVRRMIARRLLWWNAAPAVSAIDPAIADRLARELRDSVERLEAIIGRDLTTWKVPPRPAQHGLPAN